MEQTKKAGQGKNAGKNAKNTAKEAEKVEAQEAAQEPEAAEQASEVSEEPEAKEQAPEVPKEPDVEVEQEQDIFANLPNPCVYCGPSVKGVARQYTTYQGGIPDALRKFIQEHPGALGLIVSTGKFPAMHKRLETHGTKEAELYKAVKAEL